ncbi:RNA polymerase sigma-70 factor [Streptomyces sp. NBC_01762]|uniref:RNA polymerase sigma-70 factor n=1 Tax=unclassified Streptomyces TaxID=2593676 RepID=UPI002DDA008D|nr:MULTISPECIES: RNA polymerase sigma-70 factor [unclassified Streptomyces]WSC43066.1 RNA polymerase sigma-70 factor [Streptomyces sp. NBC_01762]WSD22603.1 RNA polymerase sigma-70 factor [Streptomyces sp. NBC_01751]
MSSKNDPAEGAESLQEAEAVFRDVRGRMFGIAYRMLGSVSEAEDILQEVWIRWQTYDRSKVQNPQAFLATTTTRLAINVLQSARVRRETYVGPWLPEPVDTSSDPALGAERGEALEVAVLMLLEKLTPTERAAYVLRQAFDYPYEQIAEIIGQTNANVRQLVSRARKHLAAEKRASVAAAEHQRFLTAFVAAAQTGNVAALEELFAQDVVSYSDGGGAVRASKFPVVGSHRVARYIHAFADTFWSGVTVEPVETNGRAAVRLYRDGNVLAVVTVSVTAEGIDRVLWMMNPSKLAAMAA